MGNTFVLGSVPNLDTWYPDLDEKKNFALEKYLKKIIKNGFIEIDDLINCYHQKILHDDFNTNSLYILS